MTNDLAILTNDGWSDAAAEAHERAVRGTLLKFSDWRWTRGKEAAEVATGTELVATRTARAWVKWWGGQPVETRLCQPGTRMPEREELPDLDQILWEKGPDGKYRDPWANTRFVYLVDPHTAESFTFSTSSWGGRECVNNLGDAIGRMRAAHPDAVPVVALEAAPMATKFGRKSKPVLRITGWKSAGSGVWDAQQQLPLGKTDADINDVIGF